MTVPMARGGAAASDRAGVFLSKQGLKLSEIVLE
jgi:hypothetical protein